MAKKNNHLTRELNLPVVDQPLEVMHLPDVISAPDFPTTVSFPTTDCDVTRFVVSKSNKLIEGQSLLTSSEQKVLAACIALVNPTQAYPDGITVELSDDQLSTLTGIKKKHLYRFINDAAEHFHSIPIRTPGARKGTVDVINIAERSRYDPEERIFKIKFHKLMENELLQLARYTRYQLKHLVRLDSKYAIRLYEFLSMLYNDKRGGVQYSRIKLASLHFSLGLTKQNGEPIVESYTKDYPAFRRRVLEIAVREINEKTDLQVTFNPYRAGHSIAGIDFRLQRQTTYNDGPDADDSLLDHLKSLGVTEPLAKSWLKQYEESVIRANLVVFHERASLGSEIRSAPALLNWLLKNNVAALPKVANPFSDWYAQGSPRQAFARSFLLPIWWDLDVEARSYIEAGSDIAKNPVLANIFTQFSEIAEAYSVDESLELMDAKALKHEIESKFFELQEQGALK